MGGGGAGKARQFAAGNLGAPPTEAEMRVLRGLHAGAVTVVTTTTERGFRGLTATAFTVVSLAPPRVLVCLDQGSEGLEILAATGRFAISLLSDQQEFLAERFAGRAPLVNPRFEGVKHHVTTSGNPVLIDSLAWFDCTVELTQPVGDHVVVYGAVVEAGTGDGVEPLIYFEGAYRYLQIG